jgi:CBS domain-containing protein
VRQIMNCEPVSVAPATPVAEAVELVREAHDSSLPVPFTSPVPASCITGRLSPF